MKNLLKVLKIIYNLKGNAFSNLSKSKILPLVYNLSSE